MLQHRALAACVALVFLACSGCQARITSVNVTKDDRALFAIAAPFGFGPNGHIDMTLKDLQPWHRSGANVPDPNLARMGFFLTTAEAQALPKYNRSREGACLLDGENLSVLFTLANTSQGQAYEYKGELRDIVQDYDGGNFSLFFANCEPLSAVSFDLQVSLFNVEKTVEKNGKIARHSVGKDMLPTVSTDSTAAS